MNSLLFSKIKISTKILGLFVFSCSILFNITTVFAQKNEFIVVLDAGHGGEDPGKVGYKNIKEKDIALKLVLQVGKLLEEKENIKVVYTRKKDVFIGLKDRGKIANKSNADLFVSIHCNAHNSNAYGAETWVLGTHANKQNFEVAKAENSVIEFEDNYKVIYKGFNPNSPESIIGLTLMQEEYLDQSIQLASIIQDEFTVKLKRKNRGVKQAGFVVLHQTYMPSILIETGFLTNAKEALFLNSKLGQQKFSKAIYNGVINYINQLTLNTVQSTSINEIEEVKTTNTQNIYTNVEFKVQIAAGRKLETKSYNFKGLKNVERIKVGSSYKYYYGNTSNYSEIEKFKKTAQSKGFKTAFIVAFKNGEKISVDEVLKKS
ncbi:N-acetylmuramoyl-L-alanine amidase [Lutibacter sp. A80]|uniref:N-acetylmuramoyl-L-alanine amidase family protein n=1 Tax=Lutibacter sp. A80 TaxID=2918453 RepID=UPI001F05C8DA|nr:N-acetylmuramoyl-L-alanine amidase [Lutibacter sp. A80]UMB60592.1 N-acetylmuramoyl-L-alanine amidase [Lutibacter sp. A80]